MQNMSTDDASFMMSELKQGQCSSWPISASTGVNGLTALPFIRLPSIFHMKINFTWHWASKGQKSLAQLMVHLNHEIMQLTANIIMLKTYIYQ